MKPYFILSGPPGSGKSTVLDLIKDKVAVVSEPARLVLAQQRASSGRGTGDQDPRLFVSLMLDRACRDYRSASGFTVFDRGLPDLLAFCDHYRLPKQEICGSIKQFPYHHKVFWFPPWEAIYSQDDERKLDYDGTKRFGGLIRQAYVQSGYVLVMVPKTTPQQRAAFILNRIGI